MGEAAGADLSRVPSHRSAKWSRVVRRRPGGGNRLFLMGFCGAQECVNRAQKLHERNSCNHVVAVETDGQMINPRLDAVVLRKR